MKLKKKVCHLTSVHTRFDIRIFQKECVSLAKQGWDVSLIVADGLADEEAKGVKIYGVHKGVSRMNRFLKVSKNVYRKAITLNADIYHFHDAELLPYGNKLKRHGKMVIFDSHEDLPRQILGKAYIPKFARKFIAGAMEWYEDYCCKKYNAVVTATPYINNRFVKINKNSVNVNNYPFLNEFKSAYSDIGKKSNTICYVGGITKIRGLEHVVDALVQADAKLELAGGFMPSTYKDELCKSKGWNKVNYHGNVSREKVKEILNDSVAGVVTFLPYPNHVNAQPNKLFEYMSSGIPVIASNYPLWKGIIEKYDSGICVDPENSDEIAKAIQNFFNNPKEAKEKGANGRKAVEEVFNWEQEEVKLIELYDRLG